MCPDLYPMATVTWLPSMAQDSWEDAGKALKLFKGMLSGGGDSTLKPRTWTGLLAVHPLTMMWEMRLICNHCNDWLGKWRRSIKKPVTETSTSFYFWQAAVRKHTHAAPPSTSQTESKECFSSTITTHSFDGQINVELPLMKSSLLVLFISFTTLMWVGQL